MRRGAKSWHSWVFPSYVTEGTVDVIAVVAGLAQTALFADFFYVYFTRFVSAAIFVAGVDDVI